MQIDGTDESDRKTLASSMYLRLRDDILGGVIHPDAKLNIRELCDRFSVGLSPVREALSRLAAEGLIEQFDNRGFSAKSVSVPELLDLTKARCWVNEIGVRESIANGDDRWEEEVLLSFHRLSRTPRQVDGATGRNPTWETAHRNFHRSLVAACGSNWLIDTCDRFFDAAERYRNLARIAGVSRGDLEGEHRDIMQSVIDRNADEAVEKLNRHFWLTADLVRDVLGAQRGGAEVPERRPRLRKAKGHSGGA